MVGFYLCCFVHVALDIQSLLYYDICCELKMLSVAVENMCAIKRVEHRDKTERSEESVSQALFVLYWEQVKNVE